MRIMFGFIIDNAITTKKIHDSRFVNYFAYVVFVNITAFQINFFFKLKSSKRNQPLDQNTLKKFVFSSDDDILF